MIVHDSVYKSLLLVVLVTICFGMTKVLLGRVKVLRICKSDPSKGEILFVHGFLLGRRL